VNIHINTNVLVISNSLRFSKEHSENEKIVGQKIIHLQLKNVTFSCSFLPFVMSSFMCPCNLNTNLMTEPTENCSNSFKAQKKPIRNSLRLTSVYYVTHECEKWTRRMLSHNGTALSRIFFQKRALAIEMRDKVRGQSMVGGKWGWEEGWNWRWEYFWVSPFQGWNRLLTKRSSEEYRLISPKVGGHEKG
jgi:hypothetical protein